MKDVRCPQCGADLGPQAPASGVQICEYCRTVVVRGTGSVEAVGRAVGPEAARLADRQWIAALTCRLCGAPLPEDVARQPARTRCAYCGHVPRLRPGILAVLRVAVTRPSRLPPRTRHAVLFWLATGLLGVLGTSTFAVLRNDRRVMVSTVADVGPGRIERTLDVELPAFVYMASVELRPASPPRANACAGIALAPHGEAPAWTGQAQLRKDVAYGARLDIRGVAPGAYSARIVLASPEPVTVRVSIRANSRLSLGYLILLLNVFVWSMCLDLGVQNFKKSGTVRKRVARGLLAAGVLLVACTGLFRWDPFGPQGPGQTASAAASLQARDFCTTVDRPARHPTPEQ